ncbi:MAG TPA: hypothetical protein VJ785_03175 [Anaerolineales bacterium]|nr:hypothetical protein [Anaerolineales bacterium]
MNYRILFLINSFIAFLLGAAFLFVPSMAMERFGVDNYASTRLVAQFFGAAMVALGLLLWFVKDVGNESMQRGMGIALLVGAVAGLTVTALGTAAGTLRVNGWMAILFYVLLAVGYAFLVFFRKPKMEN